MAKGRPRTDSIPRFNVDTYLSSNRKFIMFKRKLGLDDAKAYLTLVRFFNYVNANCAITANLGEIHAEALAEFCFWEKEPSDLWKVLCEVGFIEPNGDIHDQETHQPLASEIRRKRKLNEDVNSQDEQKQSKANLGGNNGTEVGTNPQSVIWNLESETCNLEPFSESETHTAHAHEPPVFDLVSKTVADYNRLKPESWIECKVPNIWTREQIESQIPANHDEWDLPKIMARVKEGFLADQVHGIDYLFDSDRKKGRLNWKRILGGEFDHHKPKRNSKLAPKAGHLGAGGESEARF